MKIQLLYHSSKAPFIETPEIKLVPFDAAESFDAYDLTVINLQTEIIYLNRAANNTKLNIHSSIRTLSELISLTNSCKILLLLPQNSKFQYDYGYVGTSSSYRKSMQLKDMLKELTGSLIGDLFPAPVSLVFGHGSTALDGFEYQSDFFLDPKCEQLVSSKKLSSAGTITFFMLTDSIGATTLIITGNEPLRILCAHTGLLPTEEIVFPEWLDDVPFFDESELRKQLSETNSSIAAFERKKEKLEEQLNEYAEKKSVLCLKGKPLEEKARSMIAEILDAPDDFEDIGEEDYRYETDNTIFLFEIKGAEKNLKRDHISRADDHVQICLDRLEEEGTDKTVKGILVFSEEINNPPGDRNPYPEKQLVLANRDEIGIISTTTLLRCYEAKLENKLSAESFINSIKNNSGLIKFDLG